MITRVKHCGRCRNPFHCRLLYVPKTSYKDGSKPLCRECVKEINKEMKRMGFDLIEIDRKAYPKPGETQ